MSFEILPKNFPVFRKPRTSYFSINRKPGWIAFRMNRMTKVFIRNAEDGKTFLLHSSDVRRVSSVSKAHFRPSIDKLFLEYTGNTKRLLNCSKIRCYLAGGMAVKLFMGQKASKITKNTEDFDFHFVSNGESKLEVDTQNMVSIMSQHMNSFSKFINKKYGFKSRVFIRELKGVPVDKTGGEYKYNKVYRVFKFYILTPTKKIELVDTSLIKEQKSRFIKLHGMYIQSHGDLWRSVAYSLTSTFINSKSYIRNPILGYKRKKGLKDVGRLLNLVGSRNPQITKLIKSILNKNIEQSRIHAVHIRRQLNRNRQLRAQSSQRKRV